MDYFQSLKRQYLLQSVPAMIFEMHELSALTLEYRRECGRDSVLQSLTAIDHPADDGGVQCQHLLRLDDGAEIVRGRTEWRPKHASNHGMTAPPETSGKDAQKSSKSPEF